MSRQCDSSELQTESSWVTKGISKRVLQYTVNTGYMYELVFNTSTLLDNS